MNIPTISVQTFQDKINSEHQFVVLDIREHWEIENANLDDDRVIILPMSKLAKTGLNAIPETVRNVEFDIIIICHHGIRSAQVTNWFMKHGWNNVYSLHGGLNAFAKEVDQSIGMY